MSNRGLLFIPDISGFTKFVHQTDIEHSRLIIQELLETLINTNHIGLEISEIEGDAILFYKFGDVPDLAVLYKQVERMFCEFHKQLIAYAHTRFCQCKACVSSIDLTLKVITHYGEFTGYNVRNFSKLIGKDIIVAHQLLKNDIEQHEYWLVTDSMGNVLPQTLPGKLNWNKSEKQTETGAIPFQYAQLSHLKNELPPDPPVDLGIKKKTKVLSLYKEYDSDIISLLHGVVDFHTRKKWNVGIKDIDNVTHNELPRLGTSHRCILEKGSHILYTSSYSFTPEKVEYEETDEKKTNAIHFTFTRITETRTGLNLDLYLKSNPV